MVESSIDYLRACVLVIFSSLLCLLSNLTTPPLMSSQLTFEKAVRLLLSAENQLIFARNASKSGAWTVEPIDNIELLVYWNETDGGAQFYSIDCKIMIRVISRKAK